MTSTITTGYETLFHKPNGSYLLTHSIGLMPRTTQDCLNQNYLEPWRSANQDTWPNWLNAIGEFKQALANLFNSEPELFCPQANVSSGLTKVIQSLPEKRGRTVIVASASDFPSTGFVLQQAQRMGFTLKLLPKNADLQSIDVWNDALSADVHSVFITHVLYNTNAQLPAEEIANLCQQRGIVSIIDIAQSAGIVPIDLTSLGIDIAVGSCIKWLCGGPGAGFLWLKKELITELKPLDVGWFSHQNPFEFDIDNFEYHQDAARFWGGTPSIAPYLVATNSIKLLNKIGVSAIRQHNRNLSERIINAVPECCLSSPLNPNKKGGTTVLDFSSLNASNPNYSNLSPVEKSSLQDDIERRMQSKGIHFDSRQYGIRVSPHIYNTVEEVQELIGCFQT